MSAKKNRFKYILFFAMSLIFAVEVCVVQAVSLQSPLEGDLTVEGIIGRIAGVIFGLALLICPIAIIWGGFEIATAGGDQNKIAKGKQIILFSLVGLAIIALSAVLVEAVRSVLN